MAKCVKCGKRGLFLKLNMMGLCGECASKAKEEFDSMLSETLAKRNEMDQECNRQIAILLKARDNYKSGGSIEDAIDAYEQVLITEKAAYPGLTHRFFLADLYIKAKRYDAAWGYLNTMLLSEHDSTYKIRLLQCKILKNENKYIYAMEMLLRGYYFKWKQQGDVSYEAFFKEAKPIANKLNWDNSVIDNLFEMLSAQARVREYDEEGLIKQYRDSFQQ